MFFALYIRHFVALFIFLLPLTVLAERSIYEPDTNAKAISKDTVFYAISPDALDFPVYYTATDSTILDVKNQKVFLYGNAQVKYADMTLKAQYIEINLKTNIVYAKGLPDTSGIVAGNPEFEDKSDKFKSESITYNIKSKKGIITNVFTQQEDGYLHGQKVKKFADNSITIKNGKFTTCDREHPHFYVGMTKAKVIPNEKIISGPAYLVIDDVPLPIGIPFGYFPNTRRRSAGILLPEPGEENKKGFFLKNGGFYFGISDYADFKIMGDIYTKGGWSAGLDANYIIRYKFSGNVKVQYFKMIISEKGLPDYQNKDQYRINWVHRQDPKAHPSRQFSANVQLSSVNENRYNAYNPKDYLQNTYSSSVYYRKKITGTPFSYDVNLSHSQNNTDSIVNLTLPSIQLTMERIFPFQRKQVVGKPAWYESIGFAVSSQFSNKVSVHDTSLFKQSTLHSFKSGVKHTLPLSTSVKILKYFTLGPSVNYNERWYFAKVEKRLDTTMVIHGNDTIRSRIVNDSVPGFYRVYDYNCGASIRTTLYGFYQFKSAKITTIRHKVDPAVSFSYTPDFSTPGFGYYAQYPNDSSRMYSYYESAVYGTAPKGKNGSVGFSLSNNLEMKYKSTTDTSGFVKVPIFEAFNLSTSYNIFADSLKWAPVSVNIRTRLFKMFDINANASYSLYQINQEGKQINRFYYSDILHFGRLTSFGFRTGMRLNNDVFKSTQKNDKTSKPVMSDQAYDYFSVPWNITFNYSFTYSRPAYKSNIVQTLTFSGDFSLTKKWKTGFTSGYDIKNKDFTYTTFNISRDLHCWMMTLSVSPFGNHQFYSFFIGVRSGVLQDLKYEKKKSAYDYTDF